MVEETQTQPFGDPGLRTPRALSAYGLLAPHPRVFALPVG